MSAQFGRWNFDGSPIDDGYLAEVRTGLDPFGPDGHGLYAKNGVALLQFALHATGQRGSETKPYVSQAGRVFTWDGRLDNQTELIRELGEPGYQDLTDTAIAAEAYDKWGVAVFAKLVGDWAMAVWDPNEGRLLLAKDFLGARHLYYRLTPEDAIWSTSLDPLLSTATNKPFLEEEYIAGWLGSFPAAHLTPYREIHSVPPSCYAVIHKRKSVLHEYWRFDSTSKIHFRRDEEYEERFRELLFQSVHRRLRSPVPVLAELSGGMDSASIVCAGDILLANGGSEAPRLDTVSYFDDTEPNWNEQDYFTKVEDRRGRVGRHIAVASAANFRVDFEDRTFRSTPCCGNRNSPIQQQLSADISTHGYRVLLSGIGGDEVLGGVPTPVPELGDLLVQGQLFSLAIRLKQWALVKRKPWIHLLFETVRTFLPVSLRMLIREPGSACWLTTEFVERNRLPLVGYPSRSKLFGARVSLQMNLHTLDALRRQIASSSVSATSCYEKRYPLLDRDLLEFLFAIPREQLVRPGQRRSLMKRALRGIVPNEILDRRRKAFLVRAPRTALAAQEAPLLAMSRDMRSASMQIVDAQLFRKAIQAACRGEEVHTPALFRTIALELWLRNFQRRPAMTSLDLPAFESCLVSQCATGFGPAQSVKHSTF